MRSLSLDFDADDDDDGDFADWLTEGKPAPLPAVPTAALPGTPEKIAVLMQRRRRREQLFHPDDAAGKARKRPGLAKGDRPASGYRGVRKQGNKYVAVIRQGGRSHYLGIYSTAQEAAQAVRAATAAGEATEATAG